MVNVPSNYQSLVQEAASGTGIPYAVVAAQANAESAFNAKAVSSAGAEGWLQFMPGTYNSYAAKAGVSPGTEFDPASETKVYVVYMNELLKQEGGNLRNALAAYNAGPGNLSAGYGYADSILKAAGQGTNTTVPTSASTTGINLNPLGGLSVSGAVNDIISTIFKSLVSGPLKDIMERLGLIILGFVLVILGIHLLSGGGGSSGNVTVNEPKTEEGSEEGSSSSSKSASGSEAKTVTKKGAIKTGSEEAVEAAAVALCLTGLIP